MRQKNLQLASKIRKIEELNESYALICEVFDEADLQMVGDALKKLDNSIPDQLANLKKAVVAAAQAYAKAASGKGFFNKSAIGKITTFYETAMAVLKNAHNLAATATRGLNLDQEKALEYAITDEKIKTNLENLFTRAMIPQGFWNKLFGKNVPFLEGSQSKAAIKDFLKLSLNQLAELQKNAQTAEVKIDFKELEKDIKTNPEQKENVPQKPEEVNIDKDKLQKTLDKLNITQNDDADLVAKVISTYNSLK